MVASAPGGGEVEHKMLCVVEIIPEINFQNEFNEIVIYKSCHCPLPTVARTSGTMTERILPTCFTAMGCDMHSTVDNDDKTHASPIPNCYWLNHKK